VYTHTHTRLACVCPRRLWHLAISVPSLGLWRARTNLTTILTITGLVIVRTLVTQSAMPRTEDKRMDDVRWMYPVACREKEVGGSGVTIEPLGLFLRTTFCVVLTVYMGYSERLRTRWLAPPG
jgi:hypothetical protein